MSMRRQVGEAKALLRAKMLQVRADHLLQLQLHQSKLQSQQHAVAEAVAMQHLERQKGQLLALLRCCFPGKMTDPQDPAPGVHTLQNKGKQQWQEDRNDNEATATARFTVARACTRPATRNVLYACVCLQHTLRLPHSQKQR